MTQTRRQVWVEVSAVLVTLAIGAVLLYALLPFITTPNQQLVPPPKAMDPSQTLLAIFFVLTAIGAPLTVGIVLALVFKFVSKRVPATSSAAPEIPTATAKPRTAEPPAEMSRGRALFWKVLAAVLVLIVTAGTLAVLVAAFVQLYPAGS